jgi:hypothetical protein
LEERLKSLHSRRHIIASRSADELPEGCHCDATSKPRSTEGIAFFDPRGQGGQEMVFILASLVPTIPIQNPIHP